MEPWLGKHHLCLDVADIRSSMAFYENLGFNVELDKSDDKWVEMRYGNFFLDLYQEHIEQNLLNFRGAGYEDVAPFLRSLDLEFIREPQEFDNNSWNAEIEDPEGNRVFFNTYPAEREFEERREEFKVVYPDEPEIKLGRTDICLDVSALEAMTDFYQKLGFELDDGGKGANHTILTYSNLRLTLYTSDNSGLTINFRGGDIEFIYDHLKNEGLSFNTDLTRKGDGSLGFTLLDPDDNTIYFNTHPQELKFS